MLLGALDEINFTAFFTRKYETKKLIKNDLNFNKQYVKKTHF